MTTMRLDAIRIGERVRKDMGDLQSLADSIKRHGLMHPVVVKSDGLLVAGHRRIEASKLNGWHEIPVTVIDVEDMLSAERDENSQRYDLRPTEAVALGRLIEEQERPKVEERIQSGRSKGGLVRTGQLDSNLPSSRNPTVNHVVGRAVGMGESIYSRAKAVVVAAETDPETFGDLPGKMDQTNVTSAYRELKQRKAANGNGAKRRSFRADKSAPFEIKSTRHRQIAERQKERMVSALSTATGLCRGLEELDVKVALSVCTPDEIKTWASRSRELAKCFRAFAAKLNGGVDD
jgi:ParB/RepB/Spo0J family partition protein